MNESSSRSVSIQELGPVIAQTVNAGGTAELTVTGRSMLPLLLDRVSRVKLKAITEPRFGDMIFYRRDSGTYVLHRLISCDPDGTYTMCGDGQTVPEPGLRREQMIAAVQSFARRGKWRDCEDTLYRLWWHIHVADRPCRRFAARAAAFLRRKLKA